ncbi:PQQ-binding-like beta-propeller repeat protein [Aestuariibius sp. 2305UL40-4]|uniref:PQQ-binding-like beta-propeller repeat protein n=1 Tax=Aestuariibius violaceus TaxID=3234132 RepID=UPI00345E8029
MKASWIIAGCAALALLAGCAEREVILPGERLDVRALSGGAEVPVEADRALPIALPAQRANAEWTHRNGGPQHRIVHPALSQSLSPLFSTRIGEGDSRRARITADPVVAGGRIFTLDARSQVTAVATNGGVLWSQDLAPALDRRRDASGGGLAFGAGRLFVTTGFGDLTALDPASGQVLWVQELDAPGGSAPTVFGDLVYVSARDSRAWAVEVETGRVRYTMTGAPSTANFSGGSGVAVTEDLAIFPFASREVMATFRQGGLRRWSTSVPGERLGLAAAVAVTDISGDPVVDGNRVYVGNYGGRLVALELGSGERIWTATEGALSPVWPTGGSVFLINDLNELLRLDAETGQRIWSVDLPSEITRRFRGRDKRIHAHYGPVLAGGRLIVASSDGELRSFDPTSGRLISSVPLPGGAATNPAVAGQTLYVVNKNGQLLAFR